MRLLILNFEQFKLVSLGYLSKELCLRLIESRFGHSHETGCVTLSVSSSHAAT